VRTPAPSDAEVEAISRESAATDPVKAGDASPNGSRESYGTVRTDPSALAEKVSSDVDGGISAPSIAD